MRSKSITALVALVAVLALSAVASASASAYTPTFVPLEGGFPATFSGSVGQAKWSGPVEATSCEGGASITGEITGSKTASLTIELHQCVDEKGEACRSEGAEGGQEVLSGTATLVIADREPARAALLFTPKQEMVICEAPLWQELKGSLVIPVETSAGGKDLTFKVKGNGAGKQEHTVYVNENNEEIKGVYFKINFGTTYKQAALELEGLVEAPLSEPLEINGE